MNIWLEEVGKVEKIPNKISKEEWQKIKSSTDLFWMDEVEIGELSINHPIRRFSTPVLVESEITGNWNTLYLYISETLIMNDNVPVPNNLVNLAAKFLNICYVDSYNAVRNYIVQINKGFELLEKYNENCYFLIN